jgi:hypothetical protein
MFEIYKDRKQFVPVNGSDQMLGQCFRLEGVESQPNVEKGAVYTANPSSSAGK